MNVGNVAYYCMIAVMVSRDTRLYISSNVLPSAKTPREIGKTIFRVENWISIHAKARRFYYNIDVDLVLTIT